MYYTVIKHDSHLRTRGKCGKHEPQASVFYLSRVFLNDWSVLSQCNTPLRLTIFYARKTIKHTFSMFYTLIKHRLLTNQRRAQGPIYVIVYDNSDPDKPKVLFCRHKAEGWGAQRLASRVWIFFVVSRWGILRSAFTVCMFVFLFFSFCTDVSFRFFIFL